MMLRPAPLVAGRKSGAGLVVAPTRHESNHVLPTHAGSPGFSSRCVGTCAAGLAHPLGGTGGAFFRISLRSELGGHPAQDRTDRFKGLALRHAQQHARSRRHEAGKEGQGFGKV